MVHIPIAVLGFVYAYETCSLEMRNNSILQKVLLRVNGAGITSGAGGPVAPIAPVGPMKPRGPAGPCIPVRPRGQVAPVGPKRSRGPVGPCIPVRPRGSIGPREPVWPLGPAQQQQHGLTGGHGRRLQSQWELCILGKPLVLPFINLPPRAWFGQYLLNILYK